MKTAGKIQFVALAALLSLSVPAGSCWAQGPGAPSSSAPSSPSALSGASVPSVPAGVPVSAGSSPMVMDAAGGMVPAGQSAKPMGKPDEKIPDSVKDVVKKLSEDTKNVTIEDLNAAREAVVKLDVLIDIEKRIKDLETIRRERDEKGSAGALANAIPASALGIPRGGKTSGLMLPSSGAGMGAGGGMGSSDAAGTMMQGGQGFSSAAVVIEQITGSGGRYIARTKAADGKSKILHVGDKLSDGSEIQSISRDGVVAKRGSTVKTYQVEGVARVFSGK